MRRSEDASAGVDLIAIKHFASTASDSTRRERQYSICSRRDSAAFTSIASAQPSAAATASCSAAPREGEAARFVAVCESASRVVLWSLALRGGRGLTLLLYLAYMHTRYTAGEVRDADRSVRTAASDRCCNGTPSLRPAATKPQEQHRLGSTATQPLTRPLRRADYQRPARAASLGSTASTLQP